MASSTFDFQRTQEEGATASKEKREEFELNDCRWRLERERERGGLFIEGPRVSRVLESFSNRDSSEKKTPFRSQFFFFLLGLGLGLLNRAWPWVITVRLKDIQQMEEKDGLLKVILCSKRFGSLQCQCR